jgi:hypothetical protein
MKLLLACSGPPSLPVLLCSRGASSASDSLLPALLLSLLLPSPPLLPPPGKCASLCMPVFASAVLVAAAVARAAPPMAALPAAAATPLPSANQPGGAGHCGAACTPSFAAGSPGRGDAYSVACGAGQQFGTDQHRAGTGLLQGAHSIFGACVHWVVTARSTPAITARMSAGSAAPSTVDPARKLDSRRKCAAACAATEHAASRSRSAAPRSFFASSKWRESLMANCDVVCNSSCSREIVLFALAA